MTYIRIAWSNKIVTWIYVPNCFYVILLGRLAERSVQNCERWSFFSIFSRLGLLFQVFGQVKGWLILELHEMIRLPYVFSCSFFLILTKLAGRIVQSYEKWSFVSVFSILGFFPLVFRQWRVLESHEIIRVLHVVGCQIIFVLFYERG